MLATRDVAEALITSSNGWNSCDQFIIKAL